VQHSAVQRSAVQRSAVAAASFTYPEIARLECFASWDP
jgi:hypothetical protein